MANQVEVFNILADSTTGEGEAAISRIEGEAAASIAGLIGFSFKDSSGNVVLPQLTDDGKIPVTSDDPGVHIDGHATVTPAGLDTQTTVITLTLVAEKDYSLKFLSAANTFTTFWEIEQTDDATTSIEHAFITGPGHYTEQVNAGCLKFTAGASGTQELTLYGTQLHGPASDMHGTLCVVQIGA